MAIDSTGQSIITLRLSISSFHFIFLMHSSYTMSIEHITEVENLMHTELSHTQNEMRKIRI